MPEVSVLFVTAKRHRTKSGTPDSRVAGGKPSQRGNAVCRGALSQSDPGPRARSDPDLGASLLSHLLSDLVDAPPLLPSLPEASGHSGHPAKANRAGPRPSTACRSRDPWLTKPASAGLIAHRSKEAGRRRCVPSIPPPSFSLPAVPGERAKEADPRSGDGSHGARLALGRSGAERRLSTGVGGDGKREGGSSRRGGGDQAAGLGFVPAMVVGSWRRSALSRGWHLNAPLEPGCWAHAGVCSRLPAQAQSGRAGRAGQGRECPPAAAPPSSSAGRAPSGTSHMRGGGGGRRAPVARGRFGRGLGRFPGEAGCLRR